MQLTFYWRKQVLDTIDVTELPWMYVSITAPTKLAGATKESIEQELRIVDEAGRRYAIDVEPVDEHVAARFRMINGYVWRRTGDDAAPVARQRARERETARALVLPAPGEGAPLRDAA